MNSGKPIAVVIGDVHYQVSTLSLADSAFRQAIDKAAELRVPLIDGGDITNDKAILRGEVVNALINTMIYAIDKNVHVYLMVGNHSLLNEKGTAHALNFLTPYVSVVSAPFHFKAIDTWPIPYYNDSKVLQRFLDTIPKGSRLFIHQGVMGAEMGAYVQDRTSLPPEAFADFRVLASHYHKRQDIKCGRPRKGAVGLFSYIGSPYTISFAEANDGPKGFQVLHDDGSLEFFPTNLRKHVIVERTSETVLDPITNLNPGDLLWLKVTGSYSDLEKLDKKAIGKNLPCGSNFKLDKLYLESALVKAPLSDFTNEEIFDSIIDRLPDAADQKKYLKSLWREVLDNETT